MLTFFEYLRQRAFESVMAGAYEALELLEAKKSLEEPKAKLPPPRLHSSPAKLTPSEPDSKPNTSPELGRPSQQTEPQKREPEEVPSAQRKQSGIQNLKKKSKGPK